MPPGPGYLNAISLIRQYKLPHFCSGGHLIQQIPDDKELLLASKGTRALAFAYETEAGWDRIHVNWGPE